MSGVDFFILSSNLGKCALPHLYLNTSSSRTETSLRRCQLCQGWHIFTKFSITIIFLQDFQENAKNVKKITELFLTLNVWHHKGAVVFVFFIPKNPKTSIWEEKNGNCFILHWSVSPKLIAVHCVSAVKSEVCTFECSHGADIILTLLWFSNSISQIVLKLCFKAEKENKGYMLLWYKWCYFVSRDHQIN